MNRERVFKNTFEPACRDRELEVSGIVAGLRFGLFKYDQLPPKVRKAVDEEIRRMVDEARRSGKDGWKLNMLDIKMRVGAGAKNSKLGAKPGAVRMQGIPMPPSFVAGGRQWQEIYVEQGMGQNAAPNEPRKITARVELRQA